MKIEKRIEKGNKIRQAGLIPGVLYGSGIKSTPIQANVEDFRKEFAENGYSKTFKVKLGSKTHIVYIKDTQFDPMNTHEKIHFDLIKVAANDTMTTKVFVKYLNKEDVKKRRLEILNNLDEVEIEFPVGSGITSLEVDLSGLEEKDTLKAGDIPLPEGITLLTDPDTLILTIQSQRKFDPEEETDEEPQVEIKEVESIKQSND